jgi:transketolase N-terminal domain/subunit
MHSTPKNSIELAWLIRRDSIEMTHVSGASHIGSDLSAADAIAVFYFDVMHTDPKNPKILIVISSLWEKDTRVPPSILA